MLAKRIIPCLDVSDGKVVKGVRFRNHQIIGDILSLATSYSDGGADELVFYDITASCQKRQLNKNWINLIAEHINIPFCVAGGIHSVLDAEAILNAGADKISINSPALENPHLIDELVKAFGSQCIVIGIDSKLINKNYFVCQYTGSEKMSKVTTRTTIDWVNEVQARGAGEIVLNCMDQDGVKEGYAIEILKTIGLLTKVPLIASGGAGKLWHFLEVFNQTTVSGALAASVFHKGEIMIADLKQYLLKNKILVRS